MRYVKNLKSDCPHELKTFESINFGLFKTGLSGQFVKAKGICTKCNRIIEIQYDLEGITNKSECQIEQGNPEHCSSISFGTWNDLNRIELSLKLLQVTGKCKSCNKKIVGRFKYKDHEWLKSNMVDKQIDKEWKDWNCGIGMTTNEILLSSHRFASKFKGKNILGSYNEKGEPTEISVSDITISKVKEEKKFRVKEVQIHESQWVRARDYQ